MKLRIIYLTAIATGNEQNASLVESQSLLLAPTLTPALFFWEKTGRCEQKKVINTIKKILVLQTLGRGKSDNANSVWKIKLLDSHS